MKSDQFSLFTLFVVIMTCWPENNTRINPHSSFYFNSLEGVTKQTCMLSLFVNNNEVGRFIGNMELDMELRHEFNAMILQVFLKFLLRFNNGLVIELVIECCDEFVCNVMFYFSQFHSQNDIRMSKKAVFNIPKSYSNTFSCHCVVLIHNNNNTNNT